MKMVISMKELRYFGEQFELGNSDEIVWECEKESGERELERTEWEIEIEGAENISMGWGFSLGIFWNGDFCLL